MNFNMSRVRKEYVDTCDIDSNLRDILVDKIREFLIKKTKTIPLERSVIEDVFTESFVNDLRKVVTDYWRSAYENRAKCIMDKGQFIDLYMARQ